jgi:O-antigen/teichoic acid export membrane protein
VPRGARGVAGRRLNAGAARLLADRNLRDIAGGAALTLLLRVAGGALEFVLNLLVARAFGASGAGVFYMALTVTTIGSVFARLGLDNSLLRLSAAHAATGEWGLVASTARRGLLAAALVSVAVSGVIFAGAGWVKLHLPVHAGEAAATQWMVLAVAPLSLAYLYGEILKAVRRIGASQVTAAVVLPAVTVLLMLVIGRNEGIDGLALAYVAGAVVAALCGAWCWRRAMAAHAGVAAPAVTMPWSRLFQGTGALLWVKSMRLATGWLATAALAWWASTAQVGIFNVAQRISLALGLLLMAVNSIVAPRFSAQLHLGDHRQLDRTARKATLLVAAVAGPAIALFLLAPQWVMSGFGPAFRTEGSAVLFVLTLGQAVNLLTGPVNYLLMMSGNEQVLSKCVTLSVLAGAAAMVLLTPAFGALGAAIATALAMALQNLASAYYVWAILGIVTIPLVRLPPRRPTP